MTGKGRIALAAALAALLSLGAAACGGKGEVEKADAPGGAVARDKAKRGAAFRNRVMRKTGKPRLPDGGVLREPGSGEPTPAELAGLWEKADAPGRGMRIEFRPVGGLEQVRVETAPPNPDEDLAFFTERARGDAERGRKNAGCFADWWAVDKVKYARVRPAGPGRWSGLETVQAVIAVLRDCSTAVPKLLPVELELDAEGRLVSSRPAEAGAKAPPEPTAIWTRVAKGGAAGAAPEGKPADAKPAKKAAGAGRK